MSELGTLYLELVVSLMEGGQIKEAGVVLQEAKEALRGSDQEGRLTVAEGDLAAAQGEYRIALALLAAIQPQQPFYLQVRQ